MKAIQFTHIGSPDVLECVDIERPVPGPGEVLVKIASSAVNFADINARRGDIPEPHFPAIPGLEYSGTIESLGNNVVHIQIGQRVVVQAYLHVFELEHVGGGYAEYAVTTTDTVVPIPDNIDFDTAAAFLGNYLTAYFMLNTQARVQAGESLLLYGAAGGIGTAVIQLAKLAGIKVFGLVSSQQRMAYVLEQGADAAINYHNEDVAKRVREITDGKGVDFVFNSAGGNTLTRDYDLLAPLGQIIWFGFAAGAPKADFNTLITDFNHFAKGKGIRTSALPSYNSKPGLWQQATKILFKYLQEGIIQPQIHGIISLTNAAHAHELMETSKVMGKLLLKP